jgi:Cu(I)/Ag(I) efflux system membrane fusion protein
VKGSQGPGFDGLRQSLNAAVQAGKRKLILLGMPTAVAEEVTTDRKVRDHLTIYSTVAGTVVEKHVDTGNYVKTGQPMFTVVDLDEVWVMLEVFEEDAGAVRLGQKVDVTVPSLPGEVFHGTVSFIDPYLEERLRVAKVRVNLENPERKLRPGAFVNAEIRVELTAEGAVHDPIAPGMWYSPMHPEIVSGEAGQCPICGMDLIQKPGDPEDATKPGPVLTVPRSAILDGGIRRLVYVQVQPPGPDSDGEEQWPAIYEPREVETGFRIHDDMVVLSGLAAGDSVVTRGQFLIDSQLQLTGRPSLMAPQGAASTDGAADPHGAHR